MTNNTVLSMKKFLNRLKVGNTRKHVEDSILSPPENPSLLSISDTLVKYKIESFALNVDKVVLVELPLLFVNNILKNIGIDISLKCLKMFKVKL